MISFIDYFKNLPNILKRVTSGSRVIPEIDGLRFLAIVPVILQHFKERMERISPTFNSKPDKIFDSILSQGHIGVYIFFCISGFILALPFAKQKLDNQKPVSLGKYYLRRLTRLEPPYIICLTLFFLVLVFLKHQSASQLLPHYWASFFYLHRIIYGVWSPINPLLWTLEVEVQFYIIAPFLAIAYFSIQQKWIRRVLIILIIVAKIVLANSTNLFDHLGITFPNVMEFFFTGILLSDIFVADWNGEINKHWIFNVITIFALLVLFSTWTWDKNILWKFLFLGALFLTIYSSFRATSVNSFFRNKWVTSLGGMCYSIYLIHLGLIEVFVGAFKRGILLTDHFMFNYFWGLLLFIPIILVASCTFFLVIEKPCMDPNWPIELYNKVFPKKV